MKPVPRRELIRKFRALGFQGPVSGGRHAFMQKNKPKVHIPGEHRRDVSVALQRENHSTSWNSSEGVGVCLILTITGKRR